MRSTAPTRWLIAREDNGRLEPLCIESSEARVLPVFSYEEEAEMFLRLGGYACDDGWRARETSADELVRVADDVVVEIRTLLGGRAFRRGGPGGGLRRGLTLRRTAFRPLRGREGRCTRPAPRDARGRDGRPRVGGAKALP